MVMKKEKEEATASVVGITTLALEGPESSAPLKGVIELSDDESEGLIASFTAPASVDPSSTGPSTAWVTTVPNTSGN
jgi:hypothetical protein